ARRCCSASLPASTAAASAWSFSFCRVRSRAGDYHGLGGCREARIEIQVRDVPSRAGAKVAAGNPSFLAKYCRTIHALRNFHRHIDAARLAAVGDDHFFDRDKRSELRHQTIVETELNDSLFHV